MTTLLTIRQLEKSFAGKIILQIGEVSLKTGESVWLSGCNGCGKTTLLRIIAGVITPNHCQSLTLNGFSNKPPSVVYLHQHPYLLSMSVKANVEYGLRRCHLPLSLANEAMRWAGVDSLATQSTRNLSGGQQRLVALARVRALRPKLYLLDEPTAYLDKDSNRRVFNLIRQLGEEGATAIISSHESTLPTTCRWHLLKGDIKVI